jgi:hypothetical protein
MPTSVPLRDGLRWIVLAGAGLVLGLGPASLPSGPARAADDDDLFGYEPSDAAWFDSAACKLPSHTRALSTGVHDASDRSKTICTLTIWICGDHFSRTTIVDRSQATCPPSYQSSSVPSRLVCCQAWSLAKHRPGKGLCNPTVDADCDGIPNDKDDEPLNPNR